MPILATRSRKMADLVFKKRVNRAKHKELYHHGTFIAEYIQKKYKAIYKEADDFYHKLRPLYPNKTKLTTCDEFKMWAREITRTSHTHQETTTRMDEETTTTTVKDEGTATVMDEGTTTQPPHTMNNIRINIPLMNDEEVQLSKDAAMLENIYPSINDCVDPETVQQIIRELQETDIFKDDMFNTTTNNDEDLNDMINAEINDSLVGLSALEKELLMY